MLQKINQVTFKQALECMELGDREWFSGAGFECDVYIANTNRIILTMIYPNEKQFKFKNIDDLRSFIYAEEYRYQPSGNY